jgi:hypothetical protein
MRRFVEQVKRWEFRSFHGVILVEPWVYQDVAELEREPWFDPADSHVLGIQIDSHHNDVCIPFILRKGEERTAYSLLKEVALVWGQRLAEEFPNNEWSIRVEGWGDDPTLSFYNRHVASSGARLTIASLYLRQ